MLVKEPRTVSDAHKRHKECECMDVCVLVIVLGLLKSSVCEDR